MYRLDPTAAYFVGDTDDLDFAFCAVAPEEQGGTAGAYLSQWGYLRLDKQLGKVRASVTTSQLPIIAS